MNKRKITISRDDMRPKLSDIISRAKHIGPQWFTWPGRRILIRVANSEDKFDPPGRSVIFVNRGRFGIGKAIYKDGLKVTNSDRLLGG